MLVLSRKKNETLMIGDNIAITILEVSGDKVKVGIEAPEEVLIYRKEIYDAIVEENKMAVNIAAGDISQLSEVLKTGGEK